MYHVELQLHIFGGIMEELLDLFVPLQTLLYVQPYTTCSIPPQ